MNAVKTPLLPRLARRVLLSYALAAAVEFWLLPTAAKELSDTAALEAIDPIRMGLIFAGALALLSLLRLPGKWERWCLVLALTALTGGALLFNFSWQLLLAGALILALEIAYARFGCAKETVPIPAKEPTRAWIWVAALAILFFLLVSAWTVARVLAFCAPTFDFGIFSQMFYYLRSTGLAMTTVERDGLMSHLQVHVSPIYYLLLPVYALFPYPVTLQICQAAVMASAAWPMYLLARQRGLRSWAACALCALLLLCPAFAGGAGYDIHENAFLTPLLLWLFYALERKGPYGAAAFAFLTLLVKEDAAVYVAAVGLYQLLRAPMSPDRKFAVWSGGGLLAGAVGWFSLATFFLARFGDGVMTYRYQNFLFGGGKGLLTVVEAAVLCPMKVLCECLEGEKLPYIAWTLLPLGLLPLLTRKYYRLVLLIPYLLVNLMSDYPYQHHIFFQYSFGSLACLAYLALLNFGDLPSWRSAAAAVLVGASLGCFACTIVPQATQYVVMYLQNYDYYQGLNSVLSLVPEGASVAATTAYTTPLSQREVLYDLQYASREHLLSCDYWVVDPRSEASFAGFGGFEALENTLFRLGYQKIGETDGALVIYARSPSARFEQDVQTS